MASHDLIIKNLNNMQLRINSMFEQQKRDHHELLEQLDILRSTVDKTILISNNTIETPNGSERSAGSDYKKLVLPLPSEPVDSSIPPSAFSSYTAELERIKSE